MKRGVVILVGAGPGDPSLLTLAGKRALEQAEVVVYDKLVHPRILDWIPASAERIFVGKQAGHFYMPQDQINKLLIELGHAGKRVIRLKGGDPLIFGRGAEELEALHAEGIDYEIIPGVTAALGTAATSGIPLTHRADSSAVTFITGQEDPNKLTGIEWMAMAKHPGTIIIYMARAKIGSIAKKLCDGGMSREMPIAFVQWGGSPRQRIRVATLGDALHGAPGEIGTPMIAIIGEVVRLRATLSWLESRPLMGQTVLLLRASDQNEAPAQRLEGLGAEVLCAPAIQILPVEDYSTLDGVLNRIHTFDWIVFSSRNGVAHFIDRLFQLGRDARRLARSKLAAIGPGTADELRRYGLVADLVPDAFRAEELVEALATRVKDQTVLLVRANRGRTLLAEALTPIARQVESVIAYRQVDVDAPPAEVAERWRAGEIDWVFLSSSSIARSYLRWLAGPLVGEEAKKPKLVSISPVTSDAIRAEGANPALEAETFTMEGMVKALLRERLSAD